MSSVDQPINAAAPLDTATDAPPPAPAEDKGKGKSQHDAMDEDDDDDDEEEEDGEEEEDVDAEESFAEIDAAAILPQGRRTRGIKIDYTSAEALKKAGLENGDAADGDEEEEFVAKDDPIETD